jgi:DNA-binding LytR/AlgR family response regulator
MHATLIADLNIILNSVYKISEIQQHQILPAVMDLITLFDKSGFKTTKGIIYESYANIMYIKANKKICYLHFCDGTKLSIMQTFAEVKKIYESNEYMQIIDRSTMVNMLYYKELLKKEKQLLIQCGEQKASIILNNVSYKRFVNNSNKTTLGI